MSMRVWLSKRDWLQPEDHYHRDIMALSDAADFLRVSPKTLKQLLPAKTIPAHQIGSSWRFSYHSLQLFLAAEWETSSGDIFAYARELTRAESARREHSVRGVTVAPHNDAHDQAMTLAEVASLLRVSPPTIRKMAEHAQIAGQRLGTQWRFSRSKVLTFFDI